MADDLDYRRLKSRKKSAIRHQDHLLVAVLCQAMAERRLNDAKLDLELMIVDCHRQGTTVSEIAHRTGISRAAIYKILHKHNALESNTHKEIEDIENAS